MLFITRTKCLEITCFSTHIFQHNMASLHLLSTYFMFKMCKPIQFHLLPTQLHVRAQH